MKKTLVVILGPTGVGKTELSLSLAEHLGSPVLNCDSRQLYAQMSIGTAAPTPQQLERVKHYFVGILQPDEYYSAAQYETDVLQLTEKLFRDHDTLLLSGGSMLYLDAVCKGIDDIPTISNEVRHKVKERLKEGGLNALLEELKTLDPEYYAIVDQHNTQRIVHAVEVCLESGQTYTSLRVRQPKQRPFRIIKIGLNRPREELFERINQRVDQMMKDGFLDEIKHLEGYRHCNALNTVGYKELFHVLDGEWPLEMAVERIKKNTRVYAKKQLTWFQRDPDIVWFHPDQKEAILQHLNLRLYEDED